MVPPGVPRQITKYTQTKSKGMEKIFHANERGKKAGLAVLISKKIDFKTKAVV